MDRFSQPAGNALPNAAQDTIRVFFLCKSTSQAQARGVHQCFGIQTVEYRFLPLGHNCYLLMDRKTPCSPVRDRYMYVCVCMHSIFHEKKEKKQYI